MREIKVKDKLLLHSSNGMTYKVIVENINEFRPPNMKYAVNMIDGNGNSYFEKYNSLYFCGDDFIKQCELMEKKE